MAEERRRYHSRLAELLADKKGEEYATTILWIRTKVSFAILRSALLCVKGSRAARRIYSNLQDTDFAVERIGTDQISNVSFSVFFLWYIYITFTGHRLWSGVWTSLRLTKWQCFFFSDSFIWFIILQNLEFKIESGLVNVLFLYV